LISRYLFNKKKLLSSVSALSAMGAAILLPTQSEAACSNSGAICVTQTTDTGDINAQGSLSWAIAQANAGGNKTIAFDPAAFGGNPKLTLTGTTTQTPRISAGVTIDGSDVPGLTIDGSNEREIFFVRPDTPDAANPIEVTIKDVTLVNGRAKGGDGGGAPSGSGNSGGGGMGAGGAIFAGKGSNVIVENVNMAGNKAQGGNANPGGGAIGNTTGAGGGGLNGGNGSNTTTATSGGGGGFGAGTDANGQNGGGPAGGTYPSGNGGAYSGGGAGNNDTSRNGGAGGFGGGGGGAGSDNGGYGGQGGFGGGGGGAAGSPGTQGLGGQGGFGGGGGAGGNSRSPSVPGYGGGSGTENNAGGGAGFGGAVFIEDGGSISYAGRGVLSGGSVTGGAGNGGSEGGFGLGTGFFLNGTSALNVAAAAGETITINDNIESDAYNGPGYQNNPDPAGDGIDRGVIHDGAGTLELRGNNSYAGGTTIKNGTVNVIADNNLGHSTGGVIFDGGTLQFGTAFNIARAMTVGSGNGTIDTMGNANTLSGTISGAGGLTKIGSGVLTLTGTNSYKGGTTVKAGTLDVSADANLGDAAGPLTLDGGTLQLTASFDNSRAVTLGAANGIIDTMGNNNAFNGIIGGAGGLTKTGSGALTLTGKNSYKGDTKVSAGSLIIDGNQLAATGRVSVDSGATLSGKGAVGGDVAIGNGGILQVSSDASGARALTIRGDLSLQQTSTINYSYGQTAGGAPANVLAVNVGGDLTLDGTININNSSGANFPVPGIYRLINYAGTLTDNGVTLGTHPTGDYFVQTSVDHQVNLVSYVGVDANFWDGAGGARNNGRIEGGDGVWQANGGNDNWTDAHGTVNVPYTDNNFAIFTGKAGTVTVDNSKGNVRVEGMQFAVDGYVVKGGDIALGSDPATIRVGDGTKAGANYDATIASRLTGTAKLVKADLGTLVLTGNNSYSGGTSVEGGALQLGDGGTSGSITGPVALAGGTSLVANRSDSLTLGGPISGDGKVVQAGTGTTMLRGANSYKGGTEINAGILNVAAAANLGDATSHVTMNGGTLQAGGSFEAAHGITLAAADNIIDTQAFNTTITGAIDGPGALHKTGTGRLILAGAETYAGRSIISQGGLALTGAGDISASSGVTADDTFDIAGIDAAGTSIKTLSGGTDGGVHLGDKQLTITAAQDDEFQGVIDGTGGLAVTGGREVFSGDNEYTGGTQIAKGGALQLGSGGNSGSVKGNIAVDGLLAFNRSDIFTADNVLTGSGTLEQIGRGTTILTADNAGFTGVTNIRSGTLQVDHTLGGAMNVLAGAYLQGEGIVGPTVNAGTIAPGNGGKDLGTLTINGDYAGNGGLIRLNTVLGDDNSATDMLVVTGNTSGTTNVRVLNRNGLGAQTDKGIKIIDVGGQSDGTFTLIGDYTTKDGKSAVVGGAYAYTLKKDGSSAPTSKGDWYLRSEYIYQPGAPLYEVYGQVLNHLNTLPTLRERAGNRYWAGAGYVPIPQGDGPGTPDPIPVPPEEDTRTDAYVDAGIMIWNRVEAAHAHHRPDTSTTGAEYDIDLWKMQLGIDGQFYEDETGRLIGSVWLHSASASADINAFYGDGRMEANGYGAGGALTWYDDGGYYLDGQAQVTWFDSDLTSSTLNRMLLDGDKSWGYALSSETGIRYSIDDAWTLTPQAQITYAQILLDDFTDPYEARVTFNRNAKLTARIGVAASYQAAWQDDEGYGQRADIYGIANLHQEFLDEVKMKISGHPLESSEEKTWAEIGAGGTYNWNDDRYVLFGTLTAGTGLTHPGDSYKFAGNAGFKVKW